MLDIVEGVAVSDVIDDDDPVCPAVVAASDRAKAFLASRVPELQLAPLPLLLQCADLKVDADGADVALRVGVVGEAQEEARLPDAGVADQQ
mmetsp:Transcript_47310/g.93679  ORF Transcript_47310/g.93679 Transcript_47310/m.93679 type:complete len:91 (-) Transcript_47310:88-360(-)